MYYSVENLVCKKPFNLQDRTKEIIVPACSKIIVTVQYIME